MITVVGRSNCLAPYLKASTQAVASQLKPLAPAVPSSDNKIVREPLPEYHANYSLYRQLPKGRANVRVGPTAKIQIRYAHTDIQIPDFSEYRRKDVKDPRASSRDSAHSRKNFTYLIVGGASVMSAYATKTIVEEFVTSMSASADVLALAKIEVKLADIPEGKNVTFKWRGKPLFIKHRTDAEISAERAVDVASLRDPQSDDDRIKKPEWLVLIGVCTHLGCVPIANAGDFGGYYCPCHGSHYDGSGRIRRGPAPLNLEVPYYEFPDESTLIVG